MRKIAYAIATAGSRTADGIERAPRLEAMERLTGVVLGSNVGNDDIASDLESNIRRGDYDYRLKPQ